MTPIIVQVVQNLQKQGGAPALHDLKRLNHIND
jgi:hypothetical protein